MEAKEVGKRIKELREQKYMNRNQLANLAGVSPTYIYQLEKGEKSPTVEYLGYICQGLGITLGEFFVQNKDFNFCDCIKISNLTEEQKKLLNEFLKSL